jgi:uncharacterized protein YPO0396
VAEVKLMLLYLTPLHCIGRYRQSARPLRKIHYQHLRRERQVVRERYLELHTGITLSLKEVLQLANHKDPVWEAADELCALLADIAAAREEQAQELLMEAQVIRECVKKYAAAEEALDASSEYYLAFRRDYEGSEEAG